MRSNLISVKAMDDHYKHPRLYVDQSLGEGRAVLLSEGQAHYLRTVMRKNAGDLLRVFNEQDGEWLADIKEAGKKAAVAVCTTQIQSPRPKGPRIHLLFPPLAKDRLDFLIEKSVELGVTDLHPITTQRCDIRKLNEARVNAQIIEAAEQCERLDIPRLHEVEALDAVLAKWDAAVPVYAALERTDAQDFRPGQGDCAILIGPPGGFADAEKEKLAKRAFVIPVTLGPRILRTETAALASLARLAD